MFDENVNVLKKMKEKNYPIPAFTLSYKNKGKPLGLTKQSRIELRKKLNQKYIGWYALIYGDKQGKWQFDIPYEQIEEEQKIGLFCKLPPQKKK
jgi:hypothetical protein